MQHLVRHRHAVIDGRVLRTSGRRLPATARSRSLSSRPTGSASDEINADARAKGGTSSTPTSPDEPSGSSMSKTPASQSPLTGAARLFADAAAEERPDAQSRRDHLRLTQGEIWTGDENQVDAVLRMLVDAHKPLRTGGGLGADTADKKIKGMLKGLKMEPRENMIKGSVRAELEQAVAIDAAEAVDSAEAIEEVNPHRTTIPPHLHRPWHATYTGSSAVGAEIPQVRYGTFIQKKARGEDLSNILELQLPPGADGKTRSRIRDARKSHRVKARFECARESAIDYRLSSLEAAEAEEGTAEVGENGEFTGNRQNKGASVLGAQKGSASGLRAWAGLVEERIQRARESGFLRPTVGIGKPIPRDPEAGNPHIESGELLMNRIVKRQGALPPWIELQNNLDGALTAFRGTLKATYTTHLVRNVISSNSLIPVPPIHAIPTSDPAWEERERKFHDENVKQINDLVRRMNALAPSIARRGLITRDMELSRAKEGLQELVWAEVRARAELAANLPARKESPYLMESEGLAKLGRMTRRSLWTIAHPVQAIKGDKAHTQGQEAGGGVGFLVFLAIGTGIVVVYTKRPAQNESAPPPRKIAETKPQLRAQSLDLEHPGWIRYYILEPIATFFRFIHLAALFGPVILLSPMLLVGSSGTRPRRRRSGSQEKRDSLDEPEENWGAVWWYGFLVRQMERAGPSFIKLGQWAASRADLFPKSLCDLMGKLHSNGDPHSIRHTRKAIEAAFDRPFDEVFVDFDEKPIGCGAIAQVYKATLKPELDAGASAVAIKILHPRVHKTVRRDIAIMMIFAKCLDALPGMEWLSLPDEVAVFGEMMNQQLDLRVEADNLHRFEANFASRGKRITFPKPIELANANSSDVLVEEFQDAVALKWFLRHGGGGYDDAIANIGLDAFLEMLLLDNWTHGDLHPGNIMVRFYKPTKTDYLAPLLHRDPPPLEHSERIDDVVHSLLRVTHDADAWHARLEELHEAGYQPQLVFIDAGLVTSLDATNRRNFLDLFQAVAEFDGYRAGKLMVERCRAPELAIDEETFALKIQHLVLSVKSKTFSLAKIKISDILTEVLGAVRRHHVKLEGDFVNTVISILLLEGIGRQLDPDMDLFKSALPILRQVGRQMGTKEALSAVPKGNIWAMIKLWVWIEARQLAGEASGVDDWIKYDRLVPAM